jgi:hypothetical protein
LDARQVSPWFRRTPAGFGRVRLSLLEIKAGSFHSLELVILLETMDLHFAVKLSSQSRGPPV